MLDMLGMSIVSLMIWLLMPSRVKEAMCGLARIMMGMYRVISLPKVSVFRWCSSNYLVTLTL